MDSGYIYIIMIILIIIMKINILEIDILGNIKMGKKMVMEKCFIIMDVSMKDIGKIIKRKDLVSFSILTKLNILAIFKMI